MSVPTPLRNCWLFRTSAFLLLVFLVNLVLSQEDEDNSNIQTLANTIHYKETLRYYVDLMFPTLTKDVRITYTNPAHQALQPLEVKPPIEVMFSSSFEKGLYSNCTNFDAIDYYSFGMICDQKTFYLMQINYEAEENLIQLSNYAVSENETLTKFTFTAGGRQKGFLYGFFLVQMQPASPERTNNTAVMIFKVSQDKQDPLKIVDRIEFFYDQKKISSSADLEELKLRESRCS